MANSEKGNQTMRTRMKTPVKERAACLAQQAAPKYDSHAKAYPNDPPLSSENLKSEIGELLWCLEFPLGKELAQSGWKLFERLLRRYMNLNVSHNPPERRLTRPGMANISQKVVR